MKMTAYIRKAYTYNKQLQRTQQTAHSACSVCHVVNISGTAESGYNCIGTNTTSQARRPFTLDNVWFRNKQGSPGFEESTRRVGGQEIKVMKGLVHGENGDSDQSSELASAKYESDVNYTKVARC